MEIKLTPNAILKPTMPPGPIEGFVDSDILLDLKGIPAEIGNCTVTGVRVTVMNPDNAIATVDCTHEGDGTWSCTVPASTKSGRMPNGVQILIDGTTPDGGNVDGYVLAVCNLAIYTRDMKIKPNGTLLRYFDVAPEAPKKCDVAPFDDVLKMYNGTEWQAFGAEIDLSDYYTKEETDQQIDRLAAYYITYNAQGAAFPTYSALANAQTYYSGGVARVPTRNDYAVVLADETHNGAEYRYIYGMAEGATTGQWEAQYPIETNDYSQLANKPSINNVELSGNKTAGDLGLVNKAGDTMTGGLTVSNLTVGNRKANTATGTNSTAEGLDVTASGNYSHAEGSFTAATAINAHAEGDNTKAYGVNSHAEGYYTTASGGRAHAEGYSTSAANYNAHAEGFETVASGNHSHAEGSGNTAAGDCSHAEGDSNTATNHAEHAEGRYNVSHTNSQNFGDSGNTLSSIGCGALPQAPKNAREIMQDGKAFFLGIGGYDGTNPTASGVKDLATVINGKADASTIRYDLGTTITASAVLADRTVNRVAPAADNTNDIVLTFPSAVAGKARDFLVLITNTTGNTGSISFTVPSGATIYGDGLATSISGGDTYLITITEVADNVFFTKATKMEVAS